MPVHATRSDNDTTSTPFDELDKVKLTKAITDKGRHFAPGLVGTIVNCHGAEAYEVEFRGIKDFFQIPAGYLEKA